MTEELVSSLMVDWSGETRVYQAWNQDAVAAVDCLDVRMSAVDVVVTAARDNPASIDKKGAIVVRDERSGIPRL